MDALMNEYIPLNWMFGFSMRRWSLCVEGGWLWENQLLYARKERERERVKGRRKWWDEKATLGHNSITLTRIYDLHNSHKRERITHENAQCNVSKYQWEERRPVLSIHIQWRIVLPHLTYNMNACKTTQEREKREMTTVNNKLDVYCQIRNEESKQKHS